MPYKDSNKQKEWKRLHYINNKEKYYNSVKARRKRNKNIANSYKISCEICGELDNNCLEFHHINSNKKKITISEGIRRAKGVDNFNNEIKKCSILCANCHRKHHYSTTLTDGKNWKNFSKARVKKREWYIEYISHKKCERCEEKDIRCLDHHHIKEKRFNIAYLLTSGNSLEFLKDEISRCIVLCVNCHRKEHAKQRHDSVV